MSGPMLEARGWVVPEARGRVVPEARGWVVPEARGRVVPEARGRVVAEARRWIGTPYLHGAARRGAGCDCLGLVRGVWAALAGAAPEAVPAYPRHEASAREILHDAARRHLREIAPDQAGPGDLLLFRLRRGAAARHLGLMAAQGCGPSFIHAYEGHGVVESPLTPPWRRRIAACFALTERIG
ncbi:NlpC/P60 family protein [Limimaricola sp.]|uniref:NlpC/P60 family protein n=1 Tax=Limimaricola sp. TaxID=2211665 RepID=UPI004059BD0B